VERGGIKEREGSATLLWNEMIKFPIRKKVKEAYRGYAGRGEREKKP